MRSSCRCKGERCASGRGAGLDKGVGSLFEAALKGEEDGAGQESGTECSVAVEEG